MDSLTWWQRVKAEPTAFGGWLQDQFRGERGAAERIEDLRDLFAVTPRARRVLTVIAAQERRHAQWIGELLTARGLATDAVKADRYWRHALPGITDLATGAAVGAHAERMRLERIEVIVADESAPADVREVFRRILPEERFHARAFAALATPEALEATRGGHELGRAALGLSP